MKIRIVKIEYIDFDYAIINPKNLIGINEFNQAFFDKIDQIEIDISNDVSFNNIVSKLDIKPIKIKNFKFSSEKNNIEKRIFDLRTNEYDIFENENNFILYKILQINNICNMDNFYFLGNIEHLIFNYF